MPLTRKANKSEDVCARVLRLELKSSIMVCSTCCSFGSRCSCREDRVFRECGVRGGMQHAQRGAVKLETDSRGVQQLGKEFAFVRMAISFVAAWVVCCHGYKAGCNACARFEPVRVLCSVKQPTYRPCAWPGRSSSFFLCALVILVCTVHLLPRIRVRE